MSIFVIQLISDVAVVVPSDRRIALFNEFLLQVAFFENVLLGFFAYLRINSLSGVLNRKAIRCTPVLLEKRKKSSRLNP